MPLFVRTGLSVMLAASLSSAMAQQSSPTTTFTVTSRLVVLDVVVVDNAGHRVTDLDKSQFIVTEDKVPQTILNFETPDSHLDPKAPIVHSSADLVRIGNAPVNIIVLDETNTPWEQMAYSRQMAEKYLNSQPELMPTPTLLVAAGDTRFKVLHDYTQSRAELLDAFHKHFPQYPWQMMRGDMGLPTERISGTLLALQQIAEASRGTPGRKNVIWIGSGFPSIESSNLFNSDFDKAQKVVKKVIARLMSARVTLTVIDPSGPMSDDSNTSSDSSGEGTDFPWVDRNGAGNMDSHISFQELAYESGGHVVTGVNNIDAQLGTALREGREYYTLSYKPTNNNENPKQYRSIKVTFANPALHAITREGYYNLPPEPVAAVASNTAKKQPEQLRIDIGSAARTQLVYNGVHIQPVKAKDGYTILATAKDLSWAPQPDGGRTAEATLLAVCYNAKDKELSQHATKVQQRIEATDDVTSGSPVALPLKLTVPPGTVRIRIVVRDSGTGNIGSANINP